MRDGGGPAQLRRKLRRAEARYYSGKSLQLRGANFPVHTRARARPVL